MRTGPIKVDFTGCRVLVTGASRGIAAAIARAFSRNGATVAVNYAAATDARAGKADAAQRLIAELGAAGGCAHAIEGDLLQPGAGRRIAAEAIATMGGVDILVLSASIQIHRDFLAMEPEDVAKQLQLNIVANIEILQGVIPAMRAAGWGRVITIGSVQEDAPSAEMPIYAMTKAAQENLVRNLAVQNAPHGVTFNNVSPGLVETDRNAFRRQDMSVWKTTCENANPMRRAGAPEDIAGAVLFLASDAASFVTGATIHATGGAHVPRASMDLQLPSTAHREVAAVG